MPANFLNLPRELRDQIYELVLVDQDYIDLGIWYCKIREFFKPKRSLARGLR
jgi:hypothetical protein